MTSELFNYQLVYPNAKTTEDEEAIASTKAYKKVKAKRVKATFPDVEEEVVNEQKKITKGKKKGRKVRFDENSKIEAPDPSTLSDGKGIGDDKEGGYAVASNSMASSSVAPATVGAGDKEGGFLPALMPFVAPALSAIAPMVIPHVFKGLKWVWNKITGKKDEPAPQQVNGQGIHDFIMSHEKEFRKLEPKLTGSGEKYFKDLLHGIHGGMLLLGTKPEHASKYINHLAEKHLGDAQGGRIMSMEHPRSSVVLRYKHLVMPLLFGRTFHALIKAGTPKDKANEIARQFTETFINNTKLAMNKRLTPEKLTKGGHVFSTVKAKIAKLYNNNPKIMKVLAVLAPALASAGMVALLGHANEGMKNYLLTRTLKEFPNDADGSPHKIPYMFGAFNKVREQRDANDYARDYALSRGWKDQSQQ